MQTQALVYLYPFFLSARRARRNHRKRKSPEKVMGAQESRVRDSTIAGLFGTHPIIVDTNIVPCVVLQLEITPRFLLHPLPGTLIFKCFSIVIEMKARVGFFPDSNGDCIIIIVFVIINL